MINYPTKPQTLFTIEQIAAQIQSGEYSAELLLMHLCHIYDNDIKAYEESVAEYEFLNETYEERKQKEECFKQFMIDKVLEDQLNKIREEDKCPF